MAIEYQAVDSEECLATWRATRTQVEAQHLDAISQLADLLADAFTRDGTADRPVIEALARGAARLNALIAGGLEGSNAIVILGIAAAELDRRRVAHGN